MEASHLNWGFVHSSRVASVSVCAPWPVARFGYIRRREPGAGQRSGSAVQSAKMLDTKTQTACAYTGALQYQPRRRTLGTGTKLTVYALCVSHIDHHASCGDRATLLPRCASALVPGTMVQTYMTDDERLYL